MSRQYHAANKRGAQTIWFMVVVGLAVLIIYKLINPASLSFFQASPFVLCVILLILAAIGAFMAWERFRPVR